jgi:hypothetical protein
MVCDIHAISPSISLDFANRPSLLYHRLTHDCIGGAYVGPARMAHFEILLDRIEEHQLSSKQFDSKLAVFVVAYTLAPKGTYPLHLRQAASALNYVLQIKEASPSQVSSQLWLQTKRT